MKVHVLTHSAVEADDPTEIYAMVAEHLDKLRELGEVKAVTVEHGELKPASDCPVKLERLAADTLPRLLIADADYQGQFGIVTSEIALSHRPHKTSMLNARELRWLAANALDMAQAIDNGKLEREGMSLR